MKCHSCKKEIKFKTFQFQGNHYCAVCNKTLAEKLMRVVVSCERSSK